MGSKVAHVTVFVDPGKVKDLNRADKAVIEEKCPTISGGTCQAIQYDVETDDGKLSETEANSLADKLSTQFLEPGIIKSIAVTSGDGRNRFDVKGEDFLKKITTGRSGSLVAASGRDKLGQYSASIRQVWRELVATKKNLSEFADSLMNDAVGRLKDVADGQTRAAAELLKACPAEIKTKDERNACGEAGGRYVSAQVQYQAQSVDVLNVATGYKWVKEGWKRAENFKVALPAALGGDSDIPGKIAGTFRDAEEHLPPNERAKLKHPISGQYEREILDITTANNPRLNNSRKTGKGPGGDDDPGTFSRADARFLAKQWGEPEAAVWAAVAQHMTIASFYSLIID